jgi:3-deoxy-7-phosphoheptulonate synthase
MPEQQVNNLNVLAQDVLITPDDLKRDIPLTEKAERTVVEGRQTIQNILDGHDPRLLVVVGPCSIHDVDAAIDYAGRLRELADQVSESLYIVMRVYFEKPRTTVGWKGLLYDPERTGQGDLAQGLVRSRRLLLNLAELGLPLATEALSPLAFSYLDDLVSWTAIGARTTESQIHREMASGLDMPVGFKNGTDGTISMAINAMKSASQCHHHLATDADGQPAMMTTPGNPNTHLVLRGGRGVTNYDAESIGQAAQALASAGLDAALLVDCSHDNAQKQAERQSDIAREVIAQKRAGNTRIKGLMLESFLAFGRQDDGDDLTYGCSITDPCLSWEQTEALIRSL